MHTVIDLENGNCLVVGEFNREIINDNGVKLVGGETAVVIAKVLLPKDDEWRPIETAPKDGTDILVYCGPISDPIWGLAHWDEGEQNLSPHIIADLEPGELSDFMNPGWMMWHQDKYAKHIWPTHWRPLPAPPNASSPRAS